MHTSRLPLLTIVGSLSVIVVLVILVLFTRNAFAQSSDTVLIYTPKTDAAIAAEILSVPESAITIETFEDGSIRYTIRGYSVAAQKIQDMDLMMATENRVKSDKLQPARDK